MRYIFNAQALLRFSKTELYQLKRELNASTEANRYAQIQLVEQALRLK